MLSKGKYFIAGLLCTAAAVKAQNVHVSGRLSGLKSPEIKFSYYVGDTRKTDLVPVADEKFDWKANITEPQRITMTLPDKTVGFFVDRGDIEISGSAAAKEKIKVTGSKAEDEAIAFEASIKELRTRQHNLYGKMNGASEAEESALLSELEALDQEKNKKEEQHIAAHPKSPFSVFLVGERTFMGSYSEVMAGFEKLDKQTQQSFAGKRIVRKLEVLKRSAIGTPVLDFTQNDTDGKPVKFADYKGKYVFIDFWASWCHPCRAENPNVLTAYNKYKDKNFTVLGISLDTKADNWKKAIQDDQMPWTQLSDLKGFNNEVSTYYGINAIPSTLLVDPQGKIIAKNLRGQALQRKLAELFN